MVSAQTRYDYVPIPETVSERMCWLIEQLPPLVIPDSVLFVSLMVGIDTWRLRHWYEGQQEDLEPSAPPQQDLNLSVQQQQRLEAAVRMLWALDEHYGMDVAAAKLVSDHSVRVNDVMMTPAMAVLESAHQAIRGYTEHQLRQPRD